jgi:hypothetical protein
MTTDADKEDLFRRARAAVKLDQYARVLAAMIHYGQDRALEIAPRFGLSLEQWRVVDEAWTGELAEGARRQQHEQALRFSAGLAKERLRLHREQPPLASIGAVNVPRSAAPVPVAAQWAGPAAGAPAAAAYAPGPSAAVSPWSEHRGAATPALVPRSAAPRAGAATADISTFVPRVSLPFDAKTPEDDPAKSR